MLKNEWGKISTFKIKYLTVSTSEVYLSMKNWVPNKHKQDCFRIWEKVSAAIDQQDHSTHTLGLSTRGSSIGPTHWCRGRGRFVDVVLLLLRVGLEKVLAVLAAAGLARLLLVVGRVGVGLVNQKLESRGSLVEKAMPCSIWLLMANLWIIWKLKIRTFIVKNPKHLQEKVANLWKANQLNAYQTTMNLSLYQETARVSL